MKLIGNTKKERAPAAEKKAGRGRVALISVLIIVAVLAATAAAGTIAVNGMDTVFPNVTVDGIEVGDLTLGETAEKLLSSGYGDLKGKSVSVQLPADYVLTLSAEEVCTGTPVADLALMAWDACHGGGAAKNALTYLRCLTGGLALESGAAITVDETAVRAAVEDAAREIRMKLLDSDLTVGEDSIVLVKAARGVEIDTDAVTNMIVEAFRSRTYDTLRYEAVIQPSAELDVGSLYASVHTEASEAYYDFEADEIVAETVGVSFDMDGAKRLWAAASYGDRIVIPLVLTEPEVTKASLEAVLFRDKLSSKTTSLYGSSANRVNNVAKAAESINGVIMMPGDSFSYNEVLGERTAANGYLPAGAYSGGKVVTEYGGGICQVSSTLYNCALLANLEITSRTNHYFFVDYLPAGLDATVSWGGPEFVFVNDRDYPIRISAWVDNGTHTVTVEIWGTDVDGSYVQMTVEALGGLKYQSYRNVYSVDGALISRKPEAASTYHVHTEETEETEDTPETEETESTEGAEGTEGTEGAETPPSAEPPEGTEGMETPPPEEGQEPVEDPVHTPAPESAPEPAPAPEETDGEGN